MAKTYQLEFEEIKSSPSASPANPQYISKEAESKINRFNPAEKLRELNRKRGEFALKAAFGFDLVYNLAILFISIV